MSVWSRRGSIPPWRVACSGLLAGLAAVIDLPAGATMLIALSAWAVARGGSVMAFAAGAAPPLALHCVLQSLVTGSPLPAELYPEAFERAGRYWAQHPAAVGSRAWFAVELLLGPQGWLTVTPMLAFGLVELHRVMLRRGDPLRPAALLVAPVVALLVAYYAWGVRRTDFAGSSFGTRHLLAITPLCYFFAAVSLSRLRSVWWHLLFTALAIVSVLYAWEGTRNPWERIEQRLERGRERGRERVLAALQSFVIYPSSSYER